MVPWLGDCGAASSRQRKNSSARGRRPCAISNRRTAAITRARCSRVLASRPSTAPRWRAATTAGDAAARASSPAAASASYHVPKQRVTVLRCRSARVPAPPRLVCHALEATFELVAPRSECRERLGTDVPATKLEQILSLRRAIGPLLPEPPGRQRNQLSPGPHGEPVRAAHLVHGNCPGLHLLPLPAGEAAFAKQVSELRDFCAGRDGPGAARIVGRRRRPIVVDLPEPGRCREELQQRPIVRAEVDHELGFASRERRNSPRRRRSRLCNPTAAHAVRTASRRVHPLQTAAPQRADPSAIASWRAARHHAASSRPPPLDARCPAPRHGDHGTRSCRAVSAARDSRPASRCSTSICGRDVRSAATLRSCPSPVSARSHSRTSWSSSRRRVLTPQEYDWPPFNSSIVRHVSPSRNPATKARSRSLIENARVTMTGDYTPARRKNPANQRFQRVPNSRYRAVKTRDLAASADRGDPELAAPLRGADGHDVAEAGAAERAGDR